MKPYIGVTGCMSNQEVEHLLRLMPEPIDPPQLLMVGVLVSSKTMAGGKNKYPNRYPGMNDVYRIFPDHGPALNLVHYNTQEPDTLYEQLMQMTDWWRYRINGFQLNVAWPDPRIIKRYVTACPTKDIVLQVGGHAFEMIGNSPTHLVERVKEYQGLIKCVLLDPSGGHGTLLDMARMIGYLDVLYASKVDIGIGIAGGLCAETLDHVAPLIKGFPGLSIDAEGRLRDGDDHLDLVKAEAYVQKALALFAQAKK